MSDLGAGRLVIWVPMDPDRPPRVVRPASADADRYTLWETSGSKERSTQGELISARDDLVVDAPWGGVGEGIARGLAEECLLPEVTTTRCSTEAERACLTPGAEPWACREALRPA